MKHYGRKNLLILFKWLKSDNVLVSKLFSLAINIAAISKIM
jgi:hypothetical protein